MSRLKASIILCTIAIFVIYLTIGCDAHSIQVDDLEVAASGKHEKKWEKGGEAGHHESDHGSHGEKGEKGYESKHGYVLIVWILFI